MVKGAVLNVALFGRCSRFALYEHRVFDDQGLPDREYVIRDAEAISTGAVIEGLRPPIVLQTRDFAEVLEFVETAEEEDE